MRPAPRRSHKAVVWRLHGELTGPWSPPPARRRAGCSTCAAGGWGLCCRASRFQPLAAGARHGRRGQRQLEARWRRSKKQAASGGLRRQRGGDHYRKEKRNPHRKGHRDSKRRGCRSRRIRQADPRSRSNRPGRRWPGKAGCLHEKEVSAAETAETVAAETAGRAERVAATAKGVAATAKGAETALFQEGKGTVAAKGKAGAKERKSRRARAGWAGRRSDRNRSNRCRRRTARARSYLVRSGSRHCSFRRRRRRRRICRCCSDHRLQRYEALRREYAHVHARRPVRRSAPAEGTRLTVRARGEWLVLVGIVGERVERRQIWQSAQRATALRHLNRPVIGKYAARECRAYFVGMDDVRRCA